MSEFSYTLEAASSAAHDERVRRAQMSRVPDRRRRHSGRRTLASGLHSLANRIDS